MNAADVYKKCSLLFYVKNRVNSRFLSFSRNHAQKNAKNNVV